MLEGRPQWLHNAAMRLLQQSEFTDKDVEELAILCQHEANGELQKISYSFPASASHSEIGSALNILINERFREAKKNQDANNFAHVDILVKSMCSDFRILLEHTIESDLLCGIVHRFQRPVNSLRLKELCKLREKDCSFIDDLMSKFSCFEHSHSKESPVQLPTPDELLTDMTALQNWRKEYTNRTHELASA